MTATPLTDDKRRRSKRRLRVDLDFIYARAGTAHSRIDSLIERIRALEDVAHAPSPATEMVGAVPADALQEWERDLIAATPPEPDPALGDRIVQTVRDAGGELIGSAIRRKIGDVGTSVATAALAALVDNGRLTVVESLSRCGCCRKYSLPPESERELDGQILGVLRRADSVDLWLTARTVDGNLLGARGADVMDTLIRLAADGRIRRSGEYYRAAAQR